MKQLYEISINKEDDGTNVSLVWTYGKPNENLHISQLFKGDSITFKELQALITAMDDAVEWKKEELSHV